MITYYQTLALMSIVPPSRPSTINPTKSRLGHQTLKKSQVKYRPYIWPALAKKPVDHPESVSHEIQDKVSVHTEIFVGGGKFDNVFDTTTR